MNHKGYGEEIRINSTLENAFFLYKHNTTKEDGMLTTVVRRI
jgi:hypothetical protein